MSDIVFELLFLVDKIIIPYEMHQEQMEIHAIVLEKSEQLTLYTFEETFDYIGIRFKKTKYSNEEIRKFLYDRGGNVIELPQPFSVYTSIVYQMDNGAVEHSIHSIEINEKNGRKAILNFEKGTYPVSGVLSIHK